ncbi:hypothetical protein KFL_000950120 [Klebsormidium nitens]|uniref:Hexosyltransferase n=1 Tax=Klebsormidium nitens TaxID=105231 RepID=A0A1Y1HZJ0_KLENI|nr:hypothetical protein KFL_000950120 [Klebsormidium nitens]|eukprot:GAQ81936.1 hypothetical protein KFL_000950120 [Klebsormidium nitens]
MGQARFSGQLQLALLLAFSLLVLFETASFRTPVCLVAKCDVSDTSLDQDSPENVVGNENSISVLTSDGHLSEGWFADLQDLRGVARKPTELGGWAEAHAGTGNQSSIGSGFKISDGARLWLKSSVAFATPRAIEIETLGNQAGSLELTLLTLDGGHEHSVQVNASNGTVEEAGSAVFVVDLSGAQFLLWQSIEVGSTRTGPLYLRSVQIDYPSSSELLQEQVERIRAASPVLPSTRTAEPQGPSVLVSLSSLAEESHLQRRLVPLISVLAGEVDLLVFVGNNTGEAEAEALAQKYGGLPLKWRNVSDAYPPRLKEFDSWQYVYEHHVADYDCDGQILPYCMGGPGYLLNRPALTRLGPQFDTCLREWSSELSDTEFGRCVHKHLGVSCALGNSTTQELRGHFRHLYDKPFARAANLQHFALLSKAVSLHSIKLDDGATMANHMEVVKRLAENVL